MKRVFISHPFSKNMLINTMKINKICKDIKGYLPISPVHLFSFMENDEEREEIMQVCFALIDLCDEIWIYGESEGCNLEKEYAIKKLKKIVIK